MRVARDGPLCIYRRRLAMNLILPFVLVTVLSPAAVASFPIGTYDAGGVTLSFGADGAYRVLQGDKAMVEGTFKVDGDSVALTDVSGSFACPASGRTGVYSWRFDGHALTLTKMSDACEDRANDLTGHPWQKK
jgi:hypothetical protein